MRAFVVAGGLIALAPDFEGVGEGGGVLSERILGGANPAVRRFSNRPKFELVINLKTAKALGLTVPPTLLARADEVIE